MNLPLEDVPYVLCKDPAPTPFPFGELKEFGTTDEGSAGLELLLIVFSPFILIPCFIVSVRGCRRLAYRFNWIYVLLKPIAIISSLLQSVLWAIIAIGCCCGRFGKANDPRGSASNTKKYVPGGKPREKFNVWWTTSTFAGYWMWLQVFLVILACVLLVVESYLGASIGSAVTDTSGHYSFLSSDFGLVRGTSYRIDIDLAQAALDGYTLNETQSPSFEVIVPENVDSLTADFFFVPLPAQTMTNGAASAASSSNGVEASVAPVPVPSRRFSGDFLLSGHLWSNAYLSSSTRNDTGNSALPGVQLALGLNPFPDWMLVLEVIITISFLVDYALGMYAAPDRLVFYRHWYSLIDLVTILPLFAFFLIGTGPASKLLRALRALRALRIVRAYRLLSLTAVEGDSRRMFQIGFTLISVIFVFATAVLIAEDTLSDEPAVNNFHEAVYWIVITLSTIGYGDIVPSTTLTRMLMTVFAATGWLVVSFNLARLISLASKLVEYTSPINFGQKTHVLVTGAITYHGLNDFLREFFHSERQWRDSNIRVAILSRCPPDERIKTLINHPQYQNKVQYLVGTPLFDNDLKKAKTDSAFACFILTDKYASKPAEVDANSLLMAFAVSEYCVDLKANTFVQLIKTEAKIHLLQAGIPNVICLDELKLGIMGKSCLAPGLSTLFTNLVRTYTSTLDEEELNPEFSSWQEEYYHGCSHEIYSNYISFLSGKKLSDAVQAAYEQSGALLFAIGRISEDGESWIALVSDDFDRIVHPMDLGFFIAVSQKRIEEFGPRDAETAQSMAESSFGQGLGVSKSTQSAATAFASLIQEKDSPKISRRSAAERLSKRGSGTPLSDDKKLTRTMSRNRIDPKQIDLSRPGPLGINKFGAVMNRLSHAGNISDDEFDSSSHDGSDEESVTEDSLDIENDVIKRKSNLSRVRRGSSSIRRTETVEFSSFGGDADVDALEVKAVKEGSKVMRSPRARKSPRSPRVKKKSAEDIDGSASENENPIEKSTPEQKTASSSKPTKQKKRKKGPKGKRGPSGEEGAELQTPTRMSSSGIVSRERSPEIAHRDSDGVSRIQSLHDLNSSFRRSYSSLPDSNVTSVKEDEGEVFISPRKRLRKGSQQALDEENTPRSGGLIQSIGRIQRRESLDVSVLQRTKKNKSNRPGANAPPQRRSSSLDVPMEDEDRGEFVDGDEDEMRDHVVIVVCGQMIENLVHAIAPFRRRSKEASRRRRSSTSVASTAGLSSVPENGRCALHGSHLPHVHHQRQQRMEEDDGYEHTASSSSSSTTTIRRPKGSSTASSPTVRSDSMSSAAPHHDPDIVILYEHAPSKETWLSILRTLEGYSGIYFVLGSPVFHLERAWMSTAERVIIVNNPLPLTQGDLSNDETAIDASVVIAVRAIEAKFKSLCFMVAELSQGASIRYLGDNKALISRCSCEEDMDSVTGGSGGPFSTPNNSRKSRSKKHSPSSATAPTIRVDEEGAAIKIVESSSSSSAAAAQAAFSPRPRGGTASSLSDASSLAESGLLKKSTWFSNTLMSQSEQLPEYHFLPRFAAGRIFTSSMLDSLTCQIFLNTPVCVLVNLMIASGSNGPQIRHMNVPSDMDGVEYNAMLDFLVRRKKVLPLGLYRASDGPYRSPLPYVLTNPPANTVVSKNDKVFILTSKDRMR